MARLLLVPDAPWAVYRSPSIDGWPCGEVREVSPEQGAYLTSTFPGVFVAPPSSPEHRMVEAAPVAGRPVASVSTLPDHWRAAVAEIEAGDFDNCLDELLLTETRKSVTKALKARRGA